MDTSKRIKMTVTMDVTVPQAVSLSAMFEYWNQLAAQGSTREVAFHVDGDGNFHPNATVFTDQSIPILDDELRKRAVLSDRNGDRIYDFDGIAWKLRDR